MSALVRRCNNCRAETERNAVSLLCLTLGHVPELAASVLNRRKRRCRDVVVLPIRSTGIGSPPQPASRLNGRRSWPMYSSVLADQRPCSPMRMPTISRATPMQQNRQGAQVIAEIVLLLHRDAQPIANLETTRKPSAADRRMSYSLGGQGPACRTGSRCPLRIDAAWVRPRCPADAARRSASRKPPFTGEPEFSQNDTVRRATLVPVAERI